MCLFVGCSGSSGRLTTKAANTAAVYPASSTHSSKLQTAASQQPARPAGSSTATPDTSQPAEKEVKQPNDAHRFSSSLAGSTVPSGHGANAGQSSKNSSSSSSSRPDAAEAGYPQQQSAVASTGCSSSIAEPYDTESSSRKTIAEQVGYGRKKRLASPVPPLATAKAAALAAADLAAEEAAAAARGRRTLSPEAAAAAAVAAAIAEPRDAGNMHGLSNSTLQSQQEQLYEQQQSGVASPGKGTVAGLVNFWQTLGAGPGTPTKHATAALAGTIAGNKHKQYSAALDTQPVEGCMGAFEEQAAEQILQKLRKANQDIQVSKAAASTAVPVVGVRLPGTMGDAQVASGVQANLQHQQQPQVPEAAAMNTAGPAGGVRLPGLPVAGYAVTRGSIPGNPQPQEHQQQHQRGVDGSDAFDGHSYMSHVKVRKPLLELIVGEGVATLM